MPPAPDAVAARLAADADPAIRSLARRDLLGDPAPDEDVLRSPLVRGLLAGLEDRAILERPYAKWTGAHWRLVSLVELGVPAGHGPAPLVGARGAARAVGPARVRHRHGRCPLPASRRGGSRAVAGAPPRVRRRHGPASPPPDAGPGL